MFTSIEHCIFFVSIIYDFPVSQAWLQMKKKTFFSLIVSWYLNMHFLLCPFYKNLNEKYKIFFLLATEILSLKIASMQ